MLRCFNRDTILPWVGLFSRKLGRGVHYRKWGGLIKGFGMFRNAGKVGCEEISPGIEKEAHEKADGALMLGSVEILMSLFHMMWSSVIPQMALLQLNNAESKVDNMAINRRNSVIRTSVSRDWSSPHAIDLGNIRYKMFERGVRNRCVQYSEKLVVGAMTLLFSHLRKIP